MRFWFTADMHFNHERSILLCKRPFRDYKHMNEELIKRFNERVKPEDLTFHIGDFMFCRSGQPKFRELRDRLNGTLICLEGNHDYKSRNGMKTVIQNMVIRQEDKHIFLTHDPANYSNRYEYNLVGHVHGLWKQLTLTGQYFPIKLINVGVDVRNYYPVCWDDIKKEIT